MDKIILKIKLAEDIRRVSLDLPINIKQLFGIIQELFQTLEGQYSVKYIDEDGDYITLSSDIELREAVNVGKAHGNILRLFIFDQKNSKPSEQKKEQPQPQPQQSAGAFPFGNLFNDPNLINPLFSQLFANPQLFNLVPQVLNSLASNPQLLNSIPQLLQSLVNSNNNNSGNGNAIPKELDDLLRALGLADNQAIKDLLQPLLNGPLVKELLPLLVARLNAFQPASTTPSATPSSTPPSAPSSGVVHYGVICDGCEKANIPGIRFKCASCPDYDLCEACEAKKSTIHPDHSFTKIETPRCPANFAGGHPCRGFRRHHSWGGQQADGQPAVHHGVKCDGCMQFPIVGDRFKCLSCDDYDLCATCEAKKLHTPEHQFAKHTQPLYQHPRWGCRRGFSGNNNNNQGWGRCGRWARMAQQQQQQQSGGQPAVVRSLARFVTDVTIPDGSIMEPGQKFEKVWRMRNEGTSAWEDNTCLVFVGGDTLSSVDTIVVPQTVQPGQEIDLSIELTAPVKPGRYVGYYRLQLADGTRFGQRVWVDIFVNTPPVPETTPSAPPATVEETIIAQPKVDIATQVSSPDPTPTPAEVAVEALPQPPVPAVAEVVVPEPSVPEDPAELKQLIEMGFTDRQLNLELLAKYNNNMLRAIQDLLQL